MNDKENACLNYVKDKNFSSVISNDRKTSMKRPLKQNHNCLNCTYQNSNNLNIRKIYGSNDSIANAAPIKKKYMLRN